MTLSLFDQQLFEKVTSQSFPGKTSFSKTEILLVLNEMTKAEKYYPKGKVTKGQKYKVFKYFVRYCLYRNLANFDTMILLSGDKGCITGDALLELPRDLTKYPEGIPLKELAGKGPLKVYSFNTETQKIELKDCDGVEYVKNDDVYEVELISGQKIRATGDHPFLQINGEYKQLKDLYWVAKKYSNGRIEHHREMKKGKYVYTDRLRIFTRPKKLDSNNMLKIDYSPIKDDGDTTYKHLMMEYRFVAKELFGDLKDLCVHHIDGNHHNNSVDNLKLLTFIEHHYEHEMNKYHFKEKNKFCEATGYSTKKKQHIVNGSKEFSEKCRFMRTNFCKSNFEVLSKLASEREKNNVNANYVKFGGVIKSIKYIGKRDVYDVVNVKDNHNFIVNNFVVSNTGKSSFAIQLAREWCNLLGINFSAKNHIAYSNAQVMERVGNLPRFHPLISDEAVNFASAAEWAKLENRELRKKLAQVRTRHLFYILCWPMKVNKIEKSYLDSFVNYWIHIIRRGVGAIFVKDINPVTDSWRLNLFKDIGGFTEFTGIDKIKKKLANHPNFWYIITAPKPSEEFYKRYLVIREKNVYNADGVLSNMTIQDLHKAVLVKVLQDIMVRDSSLSMKRLLLYIKNEYGFDMKESELKRVLEDAEMLVEKLKSEKYNLSAFKDEDNYKVEGQQMLADRDSDVGEVAPSDEGEEGDVE